MKNSNIQWIGEIPDDWEVIAIRYLLENHISGAWGDEPKDDSDNRICMRIADFDFPKMKFKENCEYTIRHYSKAEIANKTLQYGDLLIEKSGGGEKTPVGRTVVYRLNNNALFANFMDCIRIKKSIFNFEYAKYVFYALYSIGVTNLYYNQTIGIQNLLVQKYFREVKFPLPPLATQTSIATYLDAKCSEIDGLIADINKQIETLNELKKSTITEAVTKGLNKNAKLKDSGIQWIGMIPEGWRVSRLKYLVNSITKGNGITKEQVYEDGDIECVRYGEIYSKYNNQITTCLSKTRSNEILSPKTISYGDILCAGTGELIEEIGKNVVYLGENNCLAGGDIIIIKHKQEPRFLNYLLNSNYVQSQKGSGKLKLKVVHISSMEIGNLLIAIPPFTEQQSIAAYLDTKCSEFDSIISDKQKQISTLEAYKKSLIYEYVTGKKEVE